MNVVDWCTKPTSGPFFGSVPFPVIEAEKGVQEKLLRTVEGPDYVEFYKKLGMPESVTKILQEDYGTRPPKDELEEFLEERLNSEKIPALAAIDAAPQFNAEELKEAVLEALTEVSTIRQ